MKTVQIANVDIDIHNDKVGISCSGGADSSLLLYILMKHIECPLHIFTCANKNKRYSNLPVVNNVILKCIELTGNSNVFHHVHYVEEQTSENFYLFSHFHLIKVLYTGITRNPPLNVTDEWNEPNTEHEERNPEINRDLYHRNDTFYTPFHRINKKVIAQMYKELDLCTSLYPLTRSCENVDYTEGHCGECWWCKERSWAFDLT